LLNLYLNPAVIESVGTAQVGIGNNVDFLTTSTSYKLNLRGPSYAVMSACSTSLVAVHVACQALLNGECDMALAGGVSVRVPQRAGYTYQDGGIVSPDGHCRAFDAKAGGTVFGSGLGILVLKKLEEAIADGDFIRAVIRGSAINNDGAIKVGFTAPSVEGQTEVILEALAAAGVDADSISYIETHGTGTALGDPIEMQALTQAFQSSAAGRQYCPIGSLKTNLGHLDAAAGVAGLIKTVLALENGLIPPSLNFESPNPKIDFVSSPFYVNTRLREWRNGPSPRRAGVSSLGLGGTNAHVIVEEAPPLDPSGVARPWHLLVLSAKTETALDKKTAELVDYLKQNPQTNLADLAYTCQVARKAFNYRRTLVCRDVDDTIKALDGMDRERVLTSYDEPSYRPVVFMFPGQSSQHTKMAAELYAGEPYFRSQVDLCSQMLKPYLGLDLAETLFGNASPEGDGIVDQTFITQSALFVVEYALARLLQSWGIEPEAMIGHSIGEYVAACLSGVFSLEDALRVVAARGRIIQRLERGSMLAVSLSEKEITPMLGKGLSLAAVNGPALCVVAGPSARIDEFEAGLSSAGVKSRRLRTSHAFHSEMMEPALAEFLEEVQKVILMTPQIPFISNVTGTWIEDEATDPHYWVKHLRRTVRFAEGVAELLNEPNRILLEVGPGQSLTSLVKSQTTNGSPRASVASMRHPQDNRGDVERLLSALGKLWMAGAQIDWKGFHADQLRRRIPLPTYPFERQRYWIDPQPPSDIVRRMREQVSKRPDISDWFYVPSWKRSLPPPQPSAGNVSRNDCWLIFLDDEGLGLRVVDRLEELGQDFISVRAGDRLLQAGPRDYTINPSRREDYEGLVRQVLGSGKRPNKVAHLWNVSRRGRQPDETGIDRQVIEQGFYSLLYFSQALGAANFIDRMSIWSVSTDTQEVGWGEAVLPEKVMALGPCKVIPQEHTNIRCYSIDVPLAGAAGMEKERIADYLIAEFFSPTANNTNGCSHSSLFSFKSDLTRRTRCG
jgi:acyl transferase domain-containing protein